MITASSIDLLTVHRQNVEVKNADGKKTLPDKTLKEKMSNETKRRMEKTANGKYAEYF